VRILHAIEGQNQRVRGVLQGRNQLILGPRRQRNNFRGNALMRDIAQLLLEDLGIDTLNGSIVSTSQLVYLTHSRIVTTLRDSDRIHPLGMPFQHHAHGVQAVYGL